jgi:hypothetical protein
MRTVAQALLQLRNTRLVATANGLGDGASVGLLREHLRGRSAQVGGGHAGTARGGLNRNR